MSMGRPAGQQLRASGRVAARVSVVVVVRDDAQRLRRCLDSLRRWCGESEIVVVDNGSVDETKAVGQELADIWVQCSGYVSDCRLRGAQVATGEVLAFVDADQVVVSGTLPAAVQLLEVADAVVIPERPLMERTWYMLLVSSERRITEWAGLGIPRVVSRDRYFEVGGHKCGMAFGEDRDLFMKVRRVAISGVVILHDEIPSIGALLRKYYRYGSRSYGGTRGRLLPLTGLRVQSKRAVAGRAELQWIDVVLLPAILGIKVCKTGAFVAGWLRTSLLGRSQGGGTQRRPT